jgi:acetyltransferase-like isoleucine patch superfamily enzyme
MILGNDVQISPMVDIRRPNLIQIGNHVGIDSFFVCTTQLKLGDYIHISPHVGIIGGANALLTMEDFTFLSLGSRIICATEEFQGAGLIGPLIPPPYHDNLIQKPILIQKFAGVCSNSTILPGSIISTGSIIGANSLVLSNTITKPWTIYGGSPIRELGPRNQGNMLKFADILKN